MVLIILRSNPRHQESLAGGRQSFFVFLPGFPLTFLVTIVYPFPSGSFVQLIGICNLTTLEADSFVAFLRKKLRPVSTSSPVFSFTLFTSLPKPAMRFKVELLFMEKTFLLVTNWSDGEIQNDRRVFFPLRHGKLQKTRSLPARRILYK